MYQSDLALLGRLSEERKASFLAYMEAMDAEHAKRELPYGDGSLWQTTGAECWFNYFDEGFSPSEAFDEDLSYTDADLG
jgi:hypothetical protein